MNEELLSFIWRFQYFDSTNLRTESDEMIQIMRPGQLNTNAGPDFSNARIMIGSIEWVGNIEIHTRASDWLLHQHTNDTAYQSVILHVVWENDMSIYRSDQTALPVLQLKGLVRRSIIERYNSLLKTEAGTVSGAILCESQFSDVSELQKLSMLDKALLERLDKKAEQVINLWQENKQDWEETSYQWIGQHFGFKLNDPAFLRLTQIVPLKVLLKHRDQRLQIEALLFGIAGLIPYPKSETDEEYVRDLRREFHFLSRKYGLSGLEMNAHEFKFLRLRPAGFPTVRLSQFCSFICQTTNVFTSVLQAANVRVLSVLFATRQSDYWTRHFQFGKLSKTPVPTIGKDAIHLLIINAVVPLLVAYAKHRNQPEYLDRAMQWLMELPAENNRIMRDWQRLGMQVKTAADSQALIEWHNVYCAGRRCLACNIGAALIRVN